MFVIEINDDQRQMVLAGLDGLIREIGTALSKVGSAGVPDATMKIVSLHNLSNQIANARPSAQKLDETPPAPPVPPGDEAPVSPIDGGRGRKKRPE